MEVPPVEYEKLVDEELAEDSASVRKRVEQAREVQGKRYEERGFLCNSEMGPAEVWSYCPLDESARSLLQAATRQLNLSARAFHRILKVSRTIADLDGSKDRGRASGGGVAVPVQGAGGVKEALYNKRPVSLKRLGNLIKGNPEFRARLNELLSEFDKPQLRK